MKCPPLVSGHVCTCRIMDCHILPDGVESFRSLPWDIDEELLHAGCLLHNPIVWISVSGGTLNNWFMHKTTQMKQIFLDIKWKAVKPFNSIWESLKGCNSPWFNKCMHIQKQEDISIICYEFMCWTFPKKRKMSEIHFVTFELRYWEIKGLWDISLHGFFVLFWYEDHDAMMIKYI